MKKILLTLLLLLATGCRDIIGSNKVVELKDVTLTVTEMEAQNHQWKVSGTILNNGDSTIAPLWYIEAMFYSDSTFTETFGGDNEKGNYPLEPGVTGHWTLTHHFDGVDERDYPNFAIKDLRAYKR